MNHAPALAAECEELRKRVKALEDRLKSIDDAKTTRT